jgi:ElaB/YqjD/DUF883 family membrane-anchored ribosome-binding protein
MYKTPTRQKRKHHQHTYNLYNNLEEIREALADVSNDVKNKANSILSDSVDNVREASSTVEDEVTTYVAGRPLKSVGIAIAAGIVIGYFLRR